MFPGKRYVKIWLSFTLKDLPWALLFLNHPMWLSRLFYKYLCPKANRGTTTLPQVVLLKLTVQFFSPKTIQGTKQINTNKKRILSNLIWLINFLNLPISQLPLSEEQQFYFQIHQFKNDSQAFKPPHEHQLLVFVSIWLQFL